MRDFSLHSGERLAALRIDEINLAHVTRYRFAASYLAEKNCRFGLDMFCGSGYGTAILAEKIPGTIMGIDGSGEAIQEASRCIGLSNALFVHKVFPFSLPGCWADFIVSFESFSHLEHYEGFASMLAHALAPGGTLILSAPNEERLPLAKNGFLWHIRHFRPAEIFALLTANGLELKQTWSSNSCVNKDGVAVFNNNFSPLAGELKPGDEGDNVTYVFEKSPS